jgi:hypothetical protein
LSAVD